ncbi:MAG: hypothetical protein GXO39_03765 [Thermotogae bacterium]|nr:hypothetical protein [Thermotogota bacterium]
MHKNLFVGLTVVGIITLMGVGCDKDFCEDFPNSEWCSPSPPPPPPPSEGGAYCSDTGATGYFPLVVGSSWAYGVFEGTAFDTTQDSVLNPTGNTWNENVQMSDDSTWITSYVGGPYDGLIDTAYVFLRSDTLYMRIVRRTSVGGDPIVLSAQAPFAWYPLREGDSVATDWDTLPPADYIGGDSVIDTVRYMLATVVLDTTSVVVGDDTLCAQKVRYRTTLHVVNLGATITLDSYFWWSPYVGVVKRVERNLRDTVNVRWLQKDLLNFTEP